MILDFLALKKSLSHAELIRIWQRKVDAANVVASN